MDMLFSEWLLEKMKQHGWTQADLARASGLTRQSISYYLSNKSKQPDEFALQQIARAFKIPPEEVYRAAGILPPPIHPETEKEKKLLYLANKLPDDDLDDVLEFARYRLQLAEKRGDYVAKKKILAHKTG